jgi:hypothetical protein
MTSVDTASPQLPEPASAHRPSLAATLLLLLLAAVLWGLALQELCVFAPARLGMYRNFDLRLPEATQALFPITRWFALYWYVLGLAAVPGLAVVVLITFWLRHGLRSAVLSWLWGLLLILPPLAILELTGWALFLPDHSLARLGSVSSEDSTLTREYLTPDGQLTAALQISETEQSGAGPVGEVWVIEQDGRWHIDPVEGGHEGLPRRQGQLKPEEVTALGRFLASQDLLGVFDQQEVKENPQPAVVAIRFGMKLITYNGLRLRGLMRARPPDNEIQALEFSRLVAIILYVDHLIHQDKEK